MDDESEISNSGFEGTGSVSVFFSSDLVPRSCSISRSISLFRSLIRGGSFDGDNVGNLKAALTLIYLQEMLRYRLLDGPAKRAFVIPLTSPLSSCKA